MNTQKITSNHICKTLSVFYNAAGVKIGTVDLARMMVDIDGRFVPLSITYKFRKSVQDYKSVQYLNGLKRKFFVEAYTVYINRIEERIKEINAREEKPILDHLKIQERKPTRRGFFKRILKPVYFAGSIISSIAGVVF